MKQQRLTLYKIDIKYIRNLSKHDDQILSVSPQLGKHQRPFIGIIVICDNKQYCVPLSSPKEKHSRMKNDTDFTKIYDGDKLIGVLNFNEMVPVTEQYITKINLKINSVDSPEIKRYKSLMIKQLNFCQQHQNSIISKAKRLYNIITTDKANHLLQQRCCNFSKLEQILEKYSK